MHDIVASWQQYKLELWERYRSGEMKDRHIDRLKKMSSDELDRALGLAPEEGAIHHKTIDLNDPTSGVL